MTQRRRVAKKAIHPGSLTASTSLPYRPSVDEGFDHPDGAINDLLIHKRPAALSVVERCRPMNR